MSILRNNAIKYVQISDEAGLKAVGCPWKPNTLYVLRSKGKFPKLFTKLTERKVFVVVEELERMLKEGIGS
jgi:hypothetical protein